MLINHFDAKSMSYRSKSYGLEFTFSCFLAVISYFLVNIKPVNSVYYEKMTECEGDCGSTESGVSSVQGTQLFMKFCQNTPCAIKTELCSVQCSADEAKLTEGEAKPNERNKTCFTL
jgi:hypothetical protein